MFNKSDYSSNLCKISKLSTQISLMTKKTSSLDYFLSNINSTQANFSNIRNSKSSMVILTIQNTLIKDKKILKISKLLIKSKIKQGLQQNQVFLPLNPKMLRALKKQIKESILADTHSLVIWQTKSDISLKNSKMVFHRIIKRKFKVRVNLLQIKNCKIKNNRRSAIFGKGGNLKSNKKQTVRKMGWSKGLRR